MTNCSSLLHQRVHNWTRYRYVRERARERVDRLVSKIGRTEPPYRGKEYAAECGAEVLERPMAQPGRLIPISPDSFLIHVRKDDRKERRNFSAGHEVGHICFYHGGMFPDDREDPIQVMGDQVIEEKVCDRISAALLMPLQVFRRIAAQYEPSFRSVTALAELFEVGFETALYRVIEVDAWPSGIFCRWRRRADSEKAFPRFEVEGLNKRARELTGPDLNVKNLHTLSLQKAYLSRHSATDEFVDGGRIEWAPMRGSSGYAVISLYRPKTRS